MILSLLACTTVPDENLGGDDTEFIDPVEQREYACGWDANDPGGLESTGSSNGDVMSDWTVTDQCGDEFHLWDGYGAFTLVMSPPFW